MAAHTSILAWKISQTGEPSGLQSIELQRVRQDFVTEHAHTQCRKVIITYPNLFS